MPQNVSTNTWGVAKWVVSADATQGTHTTIQAAINSASSGDIIFVRSGSYNENLTLKAGVDLITGLDQGTNGNGGVILTQGMTLPSSGICTIQGFYFQFGATANMVVDVASSTASITMYNCSWSFNGGVPFSCANGQTNISLYNCQGTNTNGVFYQIASGGEFQCYNCVLQSALSSPSASIVPSGGTAYYYNSQILFPTTLTAATFYAENCTFFTEVSGFPIGTPGNNTLITTVTSGTYEFKSCRFLSGTASAISIGTGTTVKLDGSTDINSSNTNVITGAGTLIASNVNFSGTSAFVNTTTQTVGAASGWKGATPAAGMLGEELLSNVTGVAMGATSSLVNFTSLSITPGTWLLNLNSTVTFTGAFTGYNAAISTTSASFSGAIYEGTAGVISATAGVTSVTVAGIKVTVTATTTYFAVGQAIFSAGSATGAARFNAVRIG